MPRSYPDRPILGVGVVVFRADQVLLIRRGKDPRMGQWSLPGGMQELGETVFEAAHREVMEETGVTIGEPQVIDVINSIQHDDEGRVKFHYTLIDVVSPWLDGEPVAGSDAMHAEWISLSHVRDIEMWSETVRMIETGYRMLNDD